MLCRGGTAEAAAFEGHLVEDAAAGGSERRFSLQSFLEFVGRETRGYLRDTGRTAEDFESFDTD